MSQITVDRIAVWDNIVLLPSAAAAPAARLIQSIRLRKPVWRQVRTMPIQEFPETWRVDEEAERWDGLS